MNFESINEKIIKKRPNIWDNDIDVSSGDIDLDDFLYENKPPKIVADYLYKSILQLSKRHKISAIVAVGKAYSILIGLRRKLSEEYIELKPFYLLDDLKESDIKGKNVLVFDDGINTGKSMNRVAKKLMDFKAKKLVAFAIIGTLEPKDLDLDNYKKVLAWQAVPAEDYADEHNQTILSLYEYLEQTPMNYSQVYLRLESEAEVVNTVLSLGDFKDGALRRDVPKPGKSQNLIGHVEFDSRVKKKVERFFPDVKFDFTVQQVKIRFYIYIHEDHCNLLLLPVVHPMNLLIEKCDKKWCICPRDEEPQYPCAKCVEKELEKRFLNIFFQELCINVAKYGFKGLSKRNS